ncbi:transducer protein Htr37 [Halogeometricum pallidum JCM 14848]|uniref:Transducer protein Htr37 n=1 Tax=Halogeometricum pallidum JCM 14848 TaxID=1227487 RepID=M0CV13_HALPD|nr:HAMP domain-containing methyl-accepting chemotaxis protein [Halogeometricum pallidum]ELZ27081.1 transducer protein Htr37 [Halogeometricum pallidum JCM 14848]
MEHVSQRVESRLPDRIRQNYLWRLVAIFLVISVIVGAVGIYQYQQVESTVEAEAEERLLQTAKENVEVLSAWRADHMKTVGLLSNSETLTGDDEARMNAHLASQHEQLPADIIDLSVVDLQSGEVLASTSEGQAGTTMDRVTAAAPVSYVDPNAVGSTAKHQWQGDGANVISFFSPVPGATNRVLVYSAETATVDERLKGAEGSVTQLIGTTGTIDFDGSGENAGEQYPVENSEAVERAWAGESGVVVQDAAPGLMEERHLVAYVPYHAGLILLVHEPTSSAFALGDQVAGTVALLIGVTVAGFVALGLLISRSTTKPLRDLSEKVQSLREGDLDVDLSTGREDEFAGVFRGMAALRDDLLDQRRDAERYGDVMNVAADGDLSARMDADSDSRDMRTIATSYNGMMDEIEETVVAVRQFSGDVASLSEEVAASADEVSRASSEVSTSIQHIADGATDQNDSLLAVSEEIDTMTASVQQIAASADELADYTRNSAAKGDEGRRAANEALTGIETIQKETEHTVSEMEQLDEQMSEIGEIVEVISDIAEQTNILALNANIEAARAGEAGSGFAVVSNEVKSLAEETQDSAQRIEERIASLQDQQQSVLDGMARMRTRVEEGTESVGTAIGSFEEIVEELDETNASVEEINAATSRQAESSQDILNMTEEATSISEETTAEAQTVSAAAEEQTATLSEVSEGVSRLAENASELRTHLEQFEVRDEANGASGSDAVGDSTATDSTVAAPASRPTATDGGANAQ